MTHFHELVYLYCAISCDYGRSDGLGFAGFDFRFRWSSGGSLLCGFRKRVFQDVTYKTSFSEKNSWRVRWYHIYLRLTRPPLFEGLDGRLLLARRGRVYVAFRNRKP